MSSPEELYRRCFLRWANFRRKLDGLKPLRDWRDLYSTQHMLTLIGSYLPTEPLIQMGCSWEPRYQHHHKENLIHICTWLTEKQGIHLEWPTITLATAVAEKKQGFLEIIMWHLCELLEFKPLGLPLGCPEAELHAAIEERLAKFISFTDFHFLQSKQMMFQIVQDVCGWEKNASKNDKENLVDAFAQIDSWGIPKLMKPEEVRFMGSVSEKGFLFIFAHFLPALEGRVGPKSEDKPANKGPSFLAEAPPPPPKEDSGLVEELRLQLRSTMTSLEDVKDKRTQLEKESAEEIARLTGALAVAQSQLDKERADGEYLEGQRLEREAQVQKDLAEIDSLRQQVELLRAASAEATEKARVLEEERTTQDTRIERLQAELEECRGEAGASRGQSGERIQQLEEQLTHTNAKLAQDVPQLESQVEQLKQELDQARQGGDAQVEELRRDLSECHEKNERIPELEGTVEKQSAQIAKLEAVQKQVVLLEQAFVDAQETLQRIPELESKCAHAGELQEQVADLQVRLKECQEKDVHTECVSNIQELRQKLKTSMNRSVDLEAALKKLQGEMVLEQKKTAELEATSELVGILEEEFTNAEAKNAEHAARSQAKDQYIAQLKAELEKFQGGYSQMMEREGAHTTFEGQLQAELAKYKGGYEQMLERDKAQREYATKLQAALEKYKVAYQDLAKKTKGIDFVAMEKEIAVLRKDTSNATIALEEARLNNAELSNTLKAMQLKIPLYLRRGRDSVPAPTGNVALCFTDVEGSTVQWEADAETMAAAIGAHNDLMRIKLEKHSGYEVKTEGDAFMVAFADPNKALSWCLDVQHELLEAEWPEQLMQNEKSAVEREEDTLNLLYRGLRVRMGIHWGEPTAKEDPVTGRMDYFGPMVNKSARVEGIAQGGQLLVSGEALEAMQLDGLPVVVTDLGEVQLKGLSTKTTIFQVMPESLQGRKFEPLGASGGEKAAEELRKKLKELDNANNELRKQLAQMDVSLNAAMVRTKEMQAQVRSAKMNMGDPAALVDMLGNEISELLGSQEKLESELNSVRAKERRIDQLVEAAATRKASALLDAGAMRMAVLSNQLRTASESLAEAEEREAGKDQTIEELNDRLANASGALEHAEMQVAEWQQRLEEQGEEEVARAELEVKIAQLKAELATLKEGASSSKYNDELSAKLSESESLQRALAMRIDLLEAEVDIAEAATAKMAETLRAAQDRFAAEEFDLRANIRELEKRLKV